MITQLSMDGAGGWVVYKSYSVKSFSTIEKAANYMVDKLGIQCDEIDLALIQMYSLDRNDAHFDETGTFMFSQVI